MSSISRLIENNLFTQVIVSVPLLQQCTISVAISLALQEMYDFVSDYSGISFWSEVHECH